MGYLSTLALHIKGKKEKITDVQKDYFNGLDNSPVNVWSYDTTMYQVDTFHETKKSYVNSGRYLWKELAFRPQAKHMYGEIFWKNLKWIRYFEHQCRILLDVCTKHRYSWYYVHIGEVDKDISIENNSSEIENFNEDVFKPYIIDHFDTWPTLAKPKKD